MRVTITASAATGRLLRVLRDGVDQMPREPEETSTVSLEFDDATNSALADHLCAHAFDYALNGGRLYRDGVEQPIAPPGVAYIEYQQALSLARALKTFNGLNWASLTTTQKSDALRQNAIASNRLMLIMGRLLLRELEGE